MPLIGARRISVIGNPFGVSIEVCPGGFMTGGRVISLAGPLVFPKPGATG